jgi:hypothetical protein
VSFVNRGTLNKSGAGTTTDITVPFTNSGVVNVNEGTLRLTENSQQSGALSLAEGTTLRLNGGSHAFTVESTLAGAGQLRLESGGGSFAGSLGVTGAVTLTGGNWAFDGDQTFGTYSQSGGELQGTGRVLITDSFTWTGGLLAEAGITELAAGAVAAISGGGDKYLRNGRRLLNRTTLTLTGGRLLLDNQNTAGATLENEGTLDVPDGANVVWNNFTSARPVSFVNRGTLNKSGAGTTTDITVPFTNNGTVAVQSGELRLTADSTQAGPLVLESAGRLRFHNGNHAWNDGLSFSGTGELVVSRPVTLAVPVDFGALKVTFDSAATVSGAFTISNASGGELHVNKAMTFPGNMTIAGLLKIANAAHTVTVAGTLTLAGTGTIDNAGILRAGTFVDQGGTIIGNPPVVIGLAPAGYVGFKDIKVSGGAIALAGEVSREVVLTWEAPSALGYVVETSTNLVDWTSLPAAPSPSSLRTWITRTTVPPGRHAFFRIRWEGYQLQPDR